ncbi:PhzF family phenazine biosynthesis protein [Merismopedia glauca]|uniref:PhzF family phenazine biosynthesis protein n=1 Tax=Merismopedia glauca CCAP 1448/3 TaxID=1296344 RepID=A0A2T1C872_9CYAN|nr:PhzF family phenazine biosynthesis protein [Merismopedia glauca]PSB04424.1 PhzF family phenazine biosynthesis protein [Merismopedia glauca CCAP 1448/3]
MGQKISQVNAFTNLPFAGNPAGVCILSAPQLSEWMQKIAAEMNLSETAFLIKQEDGYYLRWFTPTTEVPLCGHATLASAHVLWSEGHLLPTQAANFYTQSGLLIAKKQGEWIQLDFPVNHSQAIEPFPELSQALGVPIKLAMQNSLGYLVEVESEDLVRKMQPNFELIKALPVANIIVTSLAHLGSEYDFVSRFFAPGLGINEDPVTGAAHCCLAPFWHTRLQKKEFVAYQASSRGGVVKVSYDGDESLSASDRVFLSGQAVTIGCIQK